MTQINATHLNKITQGDAIEELRKLEDKSVDLIVIDPPYNIGKDMRWDKWETVDAYVEFMSEIFKESERVLKPTGSFYWFHNDMTQVRKLMDAIEAGTSFVYRNFITWNKRYKDSPRKYYFDNVIKTENSRSYRPLTEYCLFYTFDFEAPDRGARIGETNMYLSLKRYFREEKIKCEESGVKIDDLVPRTSNFHYFANGASFNLPSKKNLDKLQTSGFFKRSYEDLKSEYDEFQVEYKTLRAIYNEQRYTFNHQKTHHDVWEYEVAPKQGHITPKPVELIENIILHSSNKGDVVLDCFLGSGTTAVAAINTGRQFIGIEREPEYVAIANQRIADAITAKS